MHFAGERRLLRSVYDHTPAGRANFQFLVFKILFDSYDLHIFNLTSINSFFVISTFSTF